jgi:hypothetical protein
MTVTSARASCGLSSVERGTYPSIPGACSGGSGDLLRPIRQRVRRLVQGLNPRSARVVALPTPSEREKGQWYFQRYIEKLPTAREIVLMDRSWCNRGGVERVPTWAFDPDPRGMSRPVHTRGCRWPGWPRGGANAILAGSMVTWVRARRGSPAYASIDTTSVPRHQSERGLSGFRSRTAGTPNRPEHSSTNESKLGKLRAFGSDSLWRKMLRHAPSAGPAIHVPHRSRVVWCHRPTRILRSLAWCAISTSQECRFSSSMVSTSSTGHFSHVSKPIRSTTFLGSSPEVIDGADGSRHHDFAGSCSSPLWTGESDPQFSL